MREANRLADCPEWSGASPPRKGKRQVRSTTSVWSPDSPRSFHAFGVVRRPSMRIFLPVTGPKLVIRGMTTGGSDYVRGSGCEHRSMVIRGRTLRKPVIPRHPREGGEKAGIHLNRESSDLSFRGNESLREAVHPSFARSRIEACTPCTLSFSMPRWSRDAAVHGEPSTRPGSARSMLGDRGFSRRFPSLLPMVEGTRGPRR